MDPSRHGAYRPNFGTVLAVDAPSMFLVPPADSVRPDTGDVGP